MKTADFAAHLTEFLSHYLPELKNISTNTISSYCDAFRLFLGYCQDVEGMRIEKLSIDDLTPELVVIEFCSDDRRNAENRIKSA